jgi:hypothetical protein
MVSKTAEAAVKACNETGCPLVWDGSVTGKDAGAGVGEVLSALSFVQGLLVADATAAFKASDGNGTATAPIRPTSGEGSQTSSTTSSSAPTGTGDQVKTNSGSVGGCSLGMVMSAGMLGVTVLLL